MQPLGFGAVAERCAAVREEWQPGLGCADVLQTGTLRESRAAAQSQKHSSNGDVLYFAALVKH